MWRLVGVGDLLLEFLLLAVDLSPDARLPQLGGQGDGGGQVLGHGQEEHVGGGGVQAVVQIALVFQHENRRVNPMEIPTPGSCLSV